MYQPNRSFREPQSLIDAEALFAKAVEQGTDPEGYSSYGDFLFMLGRFSQAQQMFDLLLQRATDFADKWKVVALAHQQPPYMLFLLRFARGRRQLLDIRQLGTDGIRVFYSGRILQIIPKFIGRGRVFSAPGQDYAQQAR